jgi:hypothetical protein
MTLNKEYNEKYRIHEGIGREKDSSKINLPMHKFYYVTGEHNFLELDLIGYEWNKVYPLHDDKAITVASVSRDSKNRIISSIKEMKEEDYYKTLIYENKSESAIVAMYLNIKNNYHEIEISARKSQNENLDIIKKAKSMLERELKCKLTERTLEEMLTSTSKDKTKHK